MDAAGDHCGGEVMRAGYHVSDDFSVCRIRNGRFKNPNDGGVAVADAAETKGFTQDFRILPEYGRPETIRENDYAGGLRAVVLRPDEAAENGMQPHDIEICPAHHAALNFTRFTEANHREAHRGEVAELFDGLNAGFDVLDFRDGESRVFGPDVGSTLANVNEAVFVAIDERL